MSRPLFNLCHRYMPEWKKDLRRERNKLKEELSRLYKTIRELRAELAVARLERDHLADHLDSDEVAREDGCEFCTEENSA